MHDDVKIVRQAVGDNAMREALDNAPPGIFDGRSWAYWHLILHGREDAPPLPVRSLEAQPQRTQADDHSGWQNTPGSWGQDTASPSSFSTVPASRPSDNVTLIRSR